MARSMSDQTTKVATEEALNAYARHFQATWDRYNAEKLACVCVCLDCHWKGYAYQLLAQSCPVCDGRCADV